MPRKKTQFTCGACASQEPSVVSIPCGWCKEQAHGEKKSHMLCDKCFIRGCPVMNSPSANSVKEETVYEDDILPGD